MALTGKTIGELTYLQFPTNNTLIPVEYIGDTYHISFSSITYNEGTYSQFVTEAGNGVLTPGRFYLMTDFQTCYDQPNYNNVKNPIFTGNYMTGSTEPILLLAISTTGFSPTVYSTLYPQDKITYDITWNTTESSISPAKGRITERIDNFNNRTDYDHRSILFKRYNGYSYNESNPLSGLVGISGLTGTTAVLYGNTGTTFNSNFSTGSFVAVTNIFPSIFEVISVQSDSLAIISGTSISETSNSLYYSASNDGVMSYYQPNIRQNEVFEYTTFSDTTAINNYVGNYANLYSWDENPFILANNVFLDGSFINNTIGNNSYNNTFNDDCDSNQIGDSFYNNLTNDDFDGNIIGDYFNNNYITANFNNNRIGSDFNNNILIGGSFYRNNIGNDFTNNVWTNNDFQNNEIGNQFNNNRIYNDFYNNDIGNGYNNNESYSSYYRNLIGNGYNNNTVYSQFYENNIGQVFESNTIGLSANIGGSNFYENNIGNDFSNNTCLGTFAFNRIGSEVYNNTIGDGFGYGASTSQGNVIGNYFYGNTIGEYFYNNTISDGFFNNNIFDYFQTNNVKIPFLNGIDFTFYYGNITAFTYTATGTSATDGTYTNVTGNTNNLGVNADFTIEVSGNTVISVSGDTLGKYYEINDTITILGSSIGGTDVDDDVVITVTGISSTPTVYESYNCELFINSGNINRLSFYDGLDTLIIKNIND